MHALPIHIHVFSFFVEKYVLLCRFIVTPQKQKPYTSYPCMPILTT